MNVKIGPWHGDRAVNLIIAEMNRRLFAAAVMIKTHAQKLLAKEGAMGQNQLKEYVEQLQFEGDWAFKAFRRNFNRNLATTNVKGESTRVRIRRTGEIVIRGKPGLKRR